ncbi:hypothetical protein BKI52_09660 [marine bacterium AO1-C]|nr:hypothetical protein BKI52_09660 [marine bacterium AO1-C]
MIICPVCETQNEPNESNCTQCKWDFTLAKKQLFLVPNQKALNGFNEQLKSYRQRYEKTQEVNQFKASIQALEQTVAQLEQNYQQVAEQNTQLEQRVSQQTQQIDRLNQQIQQLAENGYLDGQDWDTSQDTPQNATNDNLPATSDDTSENESTPPVEADIWVASDGSGDYANIQEAIDAANDEAKIGIRAGDYYSTTPGQPCLVMNKPVFLIGESSDATQVKLHGQVQVNTQEGGLKNISISGESGAAVNIERGNIALENTEILMGINAQGKASVILSDSKIHGSTTNGIRIEAGMLLMENTEVYSNAFDGIFISPEGSYTLKNSHIHDNQRYGINSRTMLGRGIIEDTRFNSNEYGGVLVLNGQHVSIKGCAINFNTGPGIYVNESKVTITGCDLAGNRGGSIEQHGNSTVNAANNQE